MDVITEIRTDRGAEFRMKGSHTLQTLEEVRHEASESSPRSSANKTTSGTQANSALKFETDKKLGGDSTREIEPLPKTKFGKAFSMEISTPEKRFVEVEALQETEGGGSLAMEIEAPPETKFGEASTKEIEVPSDFKLEGDSVMEIEGPPETKFGETSVKEVEGPSQAKFGGASAMEIDAPPVKISSSVFVSGDFREGISEETEKEEAKENPLSSQIVSGDSEGVSREEAKEEPSHQSLPQIDLYKNTGGTAVVMEASSSTSLDSKFIMMEGNSSAPIDPILTLKKESSTRSLDSNLPPKKQSSSRSLDSKLTPSMIRRGNRVSVTVLERMQQDPLLAEHFAQLETPTAEPDSDFGSHGFEPHRSLKSTSRLKCTTDSVGIKYVNQYIVVKVLGRGTFGKVKLCLNTMDCKLYAVKILFRKWVARKSIGSTRDDVGESALREIAIMKKLNHPNVVALIEVIDDPSNRKLYLVLEYVEGGPIMANDLWHPIPEDKARLYFRDMCQGLDYLHFNKIVHRDLKPGNLLQTMDGRIKISDFGVSHMLDHESDSIHGTAGTPAFLAPEICSGGECQGRAADIWALGVCLYVMVYGEIPFPAETVVDMYRCIIEKKSLILTKDPESRISLASIMQHHWVSNQGTEPLIPFKMQKSRVSPAMAVSEAEVKAAVNVKQFGLAALSNVEPVEKHFEPGEYIMRQGEEGQEMYLINSGECEVLVESRSLTQPSRGRMEYAIAERGPGQYVGEMALNTDRTKKPPKRTASIRAKTHVVTLVVSRDQVMEVLSKNSEAAKSIADTIAERDWEMRRRMKALELSLPSFRPSSFTHTNEQESTKIEVVEHSMESRSPESDEDVTKRAGICLGCRIL